MAKSSAKRTEPAPPQKTPPKSALSFPEIPWLASLDRHSSLAYLLVASAMLAVVFGKYLFGNRLYLFDDSGTDTINIFYPSLKHVADYLRETGMPGWSFMQGIGQNIFPYSLSDPFNYPLYFAGGDRLASWIAWVECFKILLGGFFFQRYLRLMRLDGYVSVLGGLFFAFSGLAIIGSTWYVFSSNLVHAAFLLLAFEMFFQKKKLLKRLQLYMILLTFFKFQIQFGGHRID